MRPDVACEPYVDAVVGLAFAGLRGRIGERVVAVRIVDDARHRPDYAIGFVEGLTAGALRDFIHGSLEAISLERALDPFIFQSLLGALSRFNSDQGVDGRERVGRHEPPVVDRVHGHARCGEEAGDVLELLTLLSIEPEGGAP